MLSIFYLTISISFASDKQILNEYPKSEHHQTIIDIERNEEIFDRRTAICCRISGHIVDVVGSVSSYITAALAGASAIPGITDDTKRYLAIGAGIGGLVSGVLHNIKPLVERIAKEKEERAEVIHQKHNEN